MIYSYAWSRQISRFFFPQFMHFIVTYIWTETARSKTSYITPWPKCHLYWPWSKFHLSTSNHLRLFWQLQTMQIAYQYIVNRLDFAVKIVCCRTRRVIWENFMGERRWERAWGLAWKKGLQRFVVYSSYFSFAIGTFKYCPLWGNEKQP